jgi:hypothetical protein
VGKAVLAVPVIGFLSSMGARPIRRNDGRIDACCARAASGHVTAAPPRSVMNSRRLMRSPQAEDNTLPHR